MKNKKGYLISLFIIGCILFDYIFKTLTAKLQLPIWLDSLGTVLTAYTLGPVCGAIVGASVNIINGILSSSIYYMIYSFKSIAIGITLGLCAKKRYLEHLFGVLSTSFLLTMVSVTMSVPINFLFWDGNTGNIWGDGVITVLQKLGCNNFLSYIVGEFYIDFLDNIITVFLLFFIIKLFRKYIKENKYFKPNKPNKSKIPAAAIMLLTIMIISSLYVNVYAANIYSDKNTDFNTYFQTLYNSENGLTGGNVNDIAQTKYGILWIGTRSGLYRYNGIEFKKMDDFETVRNVNCLYIDEADRIWIGTDDNGLSICINESISNVLNKESGMPSDSVSCITQSSDGFYYVGSKNCLSILTLSGGLNVYTIIPEIMYAKSISADQDGNVAVVTDDGYLYTIRGIDVIEKTKFISDNDSYSCCFFDESGNLYAGTTNNQIDIYKINNGVLENTASIFCDGLNHINSLHSSEDGLIFVCADNGSGYFDMSGNYNTIDMNNLNDSINHMLVDHQGNLWFTSTELGLIRLCKTVFTEVYSKLDDGVINTVTEWKDCFYFGCDNGLEITNKNMTELLPDSLSNILTGVKIQCIKPDSKNHLWICTDGKGIIEVSETGNTRIYNTDNGTSGNEFKTFTELSDGTIAAAGKSGITYINAGTVTGNIDYDKGLVNTDINCLLEKDDGSILAGINGNGIAVIKDGWVLKTLKRADGLNSETILRMIKDSDNKGIYIVTSNSLCFMDNDNTIRELKNFPYYNNYDIVEGNSDTLFVLSSAGIYAVNKETLLSGNELDYKLLDSKKGLQKKLTPNAWNYLDDSYNLYMPADTEVIHMNLNKFDISARSYRILMKSIKIDDVTHSVERGEVIRLSRGVSRIEIVPEVVNYSINNPYVSVWLEGFDKEPRVVLQNELSNIVYTNLPTGEYIFHLAVLDSKGSKIIAETVHHIIKEKEIYDYWWFWLYFVLIFAITIIYISWLIFRTLIQKTLNMKQKELELAQKQAEMGNETILTIARTVDAKDENTSQHSIRVSEYSVMIAKELNYSEESCEELRKMALLHDIGKIGIPDSVLKKPSRLTDEEYEIMKSHVVKGADILKHFTLIKGVESGALYHHERYDGRGYVNGLKGEEIPLNARIIGIADAFDAMTANRVYRKKLDFDFVLEELKKGRGTQFDPNLVDIMLRLIENGKIDAASLYDTAKNKLN